MEGLGDLQSDFIQGLVGDLEAPGIGISPIDEGQDGTQKETQKGADCSRDLDDLWGRLEVER